MTDSDRWREAYTKLVEKYGPVEWGGKELSLINNGSRFHVYGPRGGAECGARKDFEVAAILEKWLAGQLREAGIIVYETYPGNWRATHHANRLRCLKGGEWWLEDWNEDDFSSRAEALIAAALAEEADDADTH